MSAGKPQDNAQTLRKISLLCDFQFFPNRKTSKRTKHKEILFFEHRMENLSAVKKGYQLEGSLTPNDDIDIKPPTSGDVFNQSNKAKVSRRPKGNQQTRKSIVIDHANVKTDMSQGVCGRSKGPNAKCCNGNMCRNLFLKCDAPEGMEDLALISTVLLLRAELYPKDGVQVEELSLHSLLFFIS